jgi:hypothetical protein
MTPLRFTCNTDHRELYCHSSTTTAIINKTSVDRSDRRRTRIVTCLIMRIYGRTDVVGCMSYYNANPKVASSFDTSKQGSYMTSRHHLKGVQAHNNVSVWRIYSSVWQQSPFPKRHHFSRHRLRKPHNHLLFLHDYAKSPVAMELSTSD